MCVALRCDWEVHYLEAVEEILSNAKVASALLSVPGVAMLALYWLSAYSAFINKSEEDRLEEGLEVILVQ